MGEESQTKGTTSDAASEGSDNGNQQETPELIKSADNIAKRLESANTKGEELLKRQEALEVRNRLGGIS